MNLICTIPDCGKRTEGSTGLCASHNKQRRARIPEVKQPKPIKKVGETRGERMKRFAKQKVKYLKLHPKCAVCMTAKSKDVHHKRGRENELLNEEQYFLAVCESCHRLITEDSAFAIREGYSLPRT